MLNKFIKSSKKGTSNKNIENLKEKNKLMFELSNLEVKIIVPKRIRNSSVIFRKNLVYLLIYFYIWFCYLYITNLE